MKEVIQMVGLITIALMIVYSFTPDPYEKKKTKRKIIVKKHVTKKFKPSKLRVNSNGELV